MEFHLPSSSYKTIPRPPPPSSYHRKCTNGISFSESILRCGFYKDTTIQNATRQSSRHKKVIERKQSSMDRLSSEFNKEVEKIRSMQTKLALKQQEMAIIAYQLYSATYIQSMYRGWKARLLLRQLFLQRFLQIFLSFQFKFKKFRKSQICIARYYRQWIQKRKFFQVIRMCSAAIRIQRIFRKWFLLKRAIIRRIAYKTWSHIHLFGIIKAKRRIQPLERHRYVLNSFLGGYMRRKRMMRLENKLSCFRLFYLLLHLNVIPEANFHDQEQQQQKQQQQDCDEKYFSINQINEILSSHKRILHQQAKKDLLLFLQGKNPLDPPLTPTPTPTPSAPHQDSTQSQIKSFPELLTKDIKMNPNKKYQSILDSISLIYNEISTTVDPIIPTPFILSNSYRFRSFREIVIFLFDLKKKVKIYPEVLAPPPSLSYLTNIPKSKRMISEILAKKAAWNVKLIPPSMKPFASEFMISSENIVKKEYDKLSTLKKIHLMRNMRANSTGGDTSSQQSSSPSTSLTPKPPSLGSKNLISSRLLVRRKKMINISNNQSNLSIIPSQQISEELLSKSDDISSNEMISAPSTAEQSDPHASLNSNHHDHPYEYSDTESESSIYSNDNGDDEDDDEGDGTDTKRVVTLSIDHMIPLRPSQPPPSFYKRRQNIAFTSSLSLSLSNISPLLDVQADTISGLDR